MLNVAQPLHGDHLSSVYAGGWVVVFVLPSLV